MDQIDKQLVRKNSKINDHLLEELDTVASATECTGLIPTPPLFGKRGGSLYRHLYHSQAGEQPE